MAKSNIKMDKLHLLIFLETLCKTLYKQELSQERVNICLFITLFFLPAKAKLRGIFSVRLIHKFLSYIDVPCFDGEFDGFERGT